MKKQITSFSLEAYQAKKDQPLTWVDAVKELLLRMVEALFKV